MKTGLGKASLGVRRHAAGIQVSDDGERDRGIVEAELMRLESVWLSGMRRDWRREKELSQKKKQKESAWLTIPFWDVKITFQGLAVNCMTFL